MLGMVNLTINPNKPHHIGVIPIMILFSGSLV